MRSGTERPNATAAGSMRVRHGMDAVETAQGASSTLSGDAGRTLRLLDLGRVGDSNAFGWRCLRTTNIRTRLNPPTYRSDSSDAARSGSGLFAVSGWRERGWAGGVGCAVGIRARMVPGRAWADAVGDGMGRRVNRRDACEPNGRAHETGETIWSVHLTCHNLSCVSHVQRVCEPRTLSKGNMPNTDTKESQQLGKP